MRSLTCTSCKGVEWNDRVGQNCFVCGRFGKARGRAPRGVSGHRWQPSSDPAKDRIYHDYTLMQWL